MLFWQALKNQNRLADLDLVAISKQALPNRHIVYEGAVPAIEILDQKSLAIPSNHGVPSRYKRVQQHDLVRWLATYRQLVFGKREDLAFEGAGQRFQPSWTGARVLRIVIALHPTSIPTAPFLPAPNTNTRSPTIIVRSVRDERRREQRAPRHFVGYLHSSQYEARRRYRTEPAGYFWHLS